MVSKSEISNLALANLGSSKLIANVDTEQSPEAAICRIMFPYALENTLRAAPWGIATRIKGLELVAENPNTEWFYSYRFPSDCIFFRKILSGIRNDTRDSRVSFRIISDEAGGLILTNKAQAEGEYTHRNVNVQFLPLDIITAISHKLSALIAPKITSGDPFKLVDKNEQLFRLAIAAARTNAVNEEQPDKEPVSDFERAR